MTTRKPNVKFDPSKIKFYIPHFEQFGELLHDRLHAVVFHLEEFETKFMLVTNLFDRDPARIEKKRKEGAKNVEAIFYCGTQRQREILEKTAPVYYQSKMNGRFNPATWRKERDENWKALKYEELRRDMKEVQTFRYFDKFRRGKLNITDIKVESLAVYFKKLDNIFQENEYPIISDYFDIKKDHYIGIPLLGVGLFQGIVWIVFDNMERKRFEDPKTIRRLIKIFSYEYDHLLLSWDLTEANISRKSLVDKAIEEIEVTNPIQKEANTLRYYEISKEYHNKRIERNNAVIGLLREQYQKSSIITILLDSFAHNISAHSLTTLAWWFRERAEYMKDGRDMLEALGRDINPLITHAKKFPRGRLSNELHTLFKFLLEKGAFWSGITRHTNFAGKVSSLFKVLWFDFIHNALYLGTIANTEDVRKIRINITIYGKETKQKNSKFLGNKYIKKSPKGKLLDGTLAVVNFDDIGEKESTATESVFVEKGPLFEELKAELEKMKVFFPGGIIGKHAFFTLLENEIRNVKHFKGDVLKQIQKEGLTLNISIHERPVDSLENEDPSTFELFKVGVWLKHPVDIDSDLLIARIKGLDADIVHEETFQPRLGGNYQDKICASMLLTSTFDAVQDKNSGLGRIYYPWIKTAACKIRDNKYVNREFEVSQRRFKDLAKINASLAEKFMEEAGPGYLKKYFHLWMGADIISVSDNDHATLFNKENSARYKFVCLPETALAVKNHCKRDGLIRILTTPDPIRDVGDAYKHWLQEWAKEAVEKRDTVIDFWEGGTNTGRIIWEKGKLSFINYDELRALPKRENERFSAFPIKNDIAIEHGGKLSISESELNYRSHGEFLSYFCEGKKLIKVKTIEPSKLGELFEALTTKVTVFDRRIYSRMCSSESQMEHNPDPAAYAQKIALQLSRLELYRNQLNLDFRNELIEHWETVKRHGFLNRHFVLVHLSFIEGLGYEEAKILQFIDDHILQGKSPEMVGDNFILVITTGRGRMAWWDKIRSDARYARFCTFRPIESILGAVEDALEMPDDINLKFNLTKLLFGS